MSEEDHRAAGAPGRRRRHASARRGAGARWVLAGGGVVGLGLLVAVVAGAFRAGETGGSSSGDDGHPGLPALIQADPPGEGEAGEKAESPGAPRPSASAGTASATASAGPSAATSSGPTTGEADGEADVADDGSGDGTDGGSVDGSGEKPGKSGSAPGASKRPR
jgi:hypothetical protein